MHVSIRKYGNAPYRTAVIHGGPGAAGEMEPVARRLSEQFGILEPMQHAATVDAQIDELHTQVLKYGQCPIRLVGYSWGAWLSMMVASRFPQDVLQLILISSGPFETKYTGQLQEKRLSRLDEIDRKEYLEILRQLNNKTTGGHDQKLARLGALASQADSYDAEPESQKHRLTAGSAKIYQNAWQEAACLRKEGKLLQMAASVKCPLTVIHGSADTHPAEGVRTPLSTVLTGFKFILLEKCGHTPWIERQARDVFYQILFDELNTPAHH